MSRATPTATSSSAPCVTAIATGAMAATATIRRAASSDRSPAAIGSQGLLRRSISTSSIWLIPVMNTFTHRPASSVHSRSTTFEARSSDAAITYRPTIDSDVPMSVWGRPKRHSTRSAHAAARGDARLTATGGRLIAQKLPAPATMRRQCWPAYRATGADPPFGDPRGYHGVGMEGHFWRITQPRTGAVVVAILAICRDEHGRPWAMASLAAHPGGTVRSATLPDASGRAARARAARRRRVRRRRALAARRPRSRRTARGELRRGAGVAAARVRRARARAGRARPEPVLASVAAARAGERQRAHRRRDDRPRRRGRLRREELGRGRHAAGVVVGPGARLRSPRRVRRLRRRSRRARAAARHRDGAGGRRRRRRRARSCGRCGRCASPSTSAAGAWPVAASRSRRTPMAWRRTCCRCPSRASAGAWTIGRPSTSPRRCA